MFEERKINPELQKRYREQGYWKDETLLDCWDRAVEQFPDREYVVDDRGYRYTYRELDEAAGTYRWEHPERSGPEARRSLPDI